MSQIAQLLQAAVAAHRGGQWDQAQQLYQRVVQLDPRQPDAHNLLGLLARQQGHFDQAIEWLNRALELDPTQAAYLANLGEAYRGLGQLEAAIVCYRRAVPLAPGVFEVHNNLGTLLERQGQVDEAIACYTRALQVQPRSAETHFNLGNLWQSQGQLAEAAECYRRALAIEPDRADTLCNFANALRELGDPQAALEPLERAIALRADFAAAYNNLGVALQDLARLPEAQQAFARATQLEPTRPTFHYNLGTVLKDQGHPAAALDCYEQALRLKPEYRSARASRGMALLSLGRFSAGWADYEYRAGCPHFDTWTLAQPIWDGAPLAEQTLLIHCEQGLGDTLQFIRYLRLAAARCQKIVVAVQPRLIPLLAQSGFTGLVSKEEPLPPFDVQVPLLSLPRIFDTELENVPRDVPYLAAEEAGVQFWRQELIAYRGLKIGIAWQGNKTYRGDRLRSIPLQAFAPLARISSVRLFSLQKGPGSEQLASLAERFEVVDLADRLDNDQAGFLDTAAVLRNLDLVITSDTALAHLAGGLGVKVWVALTFAPDWRWMLSGSECPWYPTMRLFRQTQLGQWSDVFQRMAQELAPASL